MLKELTAKLSLGCPTVITRNVSVWPASRVVGDQEDRVNIPFFCHLAKDALVVDGRIRNRRGSTRRLCGCFVRVKGHLATFPAVVR